VGAQATWRDGHSKAVQETHLRANLAAADLQLTPRTWRHWTSRSRRPNARLAGDDLSADAGYKRAESCAQVRIVCKTMQIAVARAAQRHQLGMRRARQNGLAVVQPDEGVCIGMHQQQRPRMRAASSSVRSG